MLAIGETGECLENFSLKSRLGDSETLEGVLVIEFGLLGDSNLKVSEGEDPSSGDHELSMVELLTFLQKVLIGLVIAELCD